ncbi:MAG: T9SS type A sorting domain-containing protein [Haliscomenobacter sp.]|nr:T9SS type A sorting domain-containing protein [Haliscomenobacter sp.]MBK9489343.1 T9SS type A sorting domain-containing protein [Haliscomenobacter sp.]
MREKGEPTAVVNGAVSVNELQNGTYKVSFYNCTTADVITTFKGLNVQNGTLNFGVPDFLWDLAFVAEKDDTTVPTLEIALDLSINIYPNPVNIGGALQIDTRNLPAGEYRIDVFNISGQLVQQKFISAFGQVESIATAGLTPGGYLLRLSQGERATVVRFVAQ